MFYNYLKILHLCTDLFLQRLFIIFNKDSVLKHILLGGFSLLIIVTSFLRRPPAGLKLGLAGWLWGRFAPP